MIGGGWVRIDRRADRAGLKVKDRFEAEDACQKARECRIEALRALGLHLGGGSAHGTVGTSPVDSLPSVLC